MKRTLLGLAAGILMLVFAGSAAADHRHGPAYGSRGYGSYNSYGYSWGYRDPIHRHSSYIPHIDYVPPHFDWHRGHYHYVPGHYDYHYRGRRYEIVPGPFGRSYLSPFPHRHD